MGIRQPAMMGSVKQILEPHWSVARDKSQVPKGHIAVYVGERERERQRKRFVVPISLLKHPSFLGLLSRAEEEFGFNFPVGALTIPCSEQVFLRLTSPLHPSL